MSIDPAPVFAILTGCFHAALFLFVFGRGGWRILLVIVAASLGAWAGDAVGGRLGLDPIRMGDFHFLAASALAWVGIGFVEVLSIMGPTSKPAEDA